MNIKLGGTRIVFIFSTFVIKIPRLHILYPIRYYLFNYRATALSGKIIFPDGMSALRYVLSGFYANRLEASYFRKHSSSSVLITTRGFLFDFIIIQPRGSPLNKNNRKWLRIKRILGRVGIFEKGTFNPINFCFIEDQIKMIDYGDSNTVQALDNANLNILEKITRALL